MNDTYNVNLRETSDEAALDDLLDRQRKFFSTNATKDVGFRRRALRRLREATLAAEDEIVAALERDLGKSRFEAYVSEIGVTLDDLKFIEKRTTKWAKPKRVPTPLAHFPAKSRILPEPYGVSLIIAPWNYPFQLAISPLLGAIAAGNTAIIKPSEIAPATAEIVARIADETFDEEYVAVVRGGVEVSKALLERRFDHIFFTGGTRVGKIVMEQAAKRLTPVTLELGGKSPAIIDASAKIETSARRLAWGKLLNAGQTCVAPDYALVHERVFDSFVEALGAAFDSFVPGEDWREDYPKIVSDSHFERLRALMKEGETLYGGAIDEETRRIQPTLLGAVPDDATIMREEIFGPLLPVLPVADLDEAIRRVNEKEKPLALYYFGENAANRDRVLRETSFGGGCVNDTIVHLATSRLPFGGVGESGMGNYHGEASFRAFSHYRSVLRKSTLLDLPLRYPPYTAKKLSWIKRVIG